MKKDEIRVGGTYLARVGRKSVEVRIDREHTRGGWDATAVATNKKVRLKHAQALRPPAEKADAGKGASKAKRARAATPDARAAGDEAGGTSAVSAEAATPVGPVQAPPPGNHEGEAASPADIKEDAAATKGPGEKSPKAMSCLDAAAEVLRDRGGPMRCKEMVAAMAERGLWTSNAPTPAATLYSAILREVARKGPNARFRKTGRGHFALAAATGTATDDRASGATGDVHAGD